MLPTPCSKLRAPPLTYSLVFHEHPLGRRPDPPAAFFLRPCHFERSEDSRDVSALSPHVRGLQHFKVSKLPFTFFSPLD
jgi:hypothetical protein